MGRGLDSILLSANKKRCRVLFYFKIFDPPVTLFFYCFLKRVDLSFRYVTRPGEGEEWWKPPATANISNSNNKQQLPDNSNINPTTEEQMELSGDSPSEEGGVRGKDMPCLDTGSLGASNSSDSPTSETSTGPNIQVEVRQENYWRERGGLG